MPTLKSSCRPIYRPIFGIFQISASANKFFCLSDVFDFYFDGAPDFYFDGAPDFYFDGAQDFYFDGESGSAWAHSAHILSLVHWCP